MFDSDRSRLFRNGKECDFALNLNETCYVSKKHKSSSAV